ncbi:protein-tyrosine phosphatase family protein [Microbacterium sp. NPDC078814]|uniref:protein-tyrosine phosphatase family protein n=1 Tax=Microbacterium sp. NPDC078814 TaxID=3154767 RepID=UPI00344CB1DD
MRPANYRRPVDSWGSDAGAVRIPDGRLVRGAGNRRHRGQVPAPEFTVYVLVRDPHLTGWPNRWVRWPDSGLPDSAEDTLDALREARTRAASERVEIACGGGIGRIGTAIAVLAVMSRTPADARRRLGPREPPSTRRRGPDANEHRSPWSRPR